VRRNTECGRTVFSVIAFPPSFSWFEPARAAAGHSHSTGATTPAHGSCTAARGGGSYCPKAIRGSRPSRRTSLGCEPALGSEPERRGTEISNPAPSSGESVNFRFLASIIRLTAGRAPIYTPNGGSAGFGSTTTSQSRRFRGCPQRRLCCQAAARPHIEASVSQIVEHHRLTVLLVLERCAIFFTAPLAGKSLPTARESLIRWFLRSW